jgi:hypothetical protein
MEQRQPGTQEDMPDEGGQMNDPDGQEQGGDQGQGEQGNQSPTNPTPSGGTNPPTQE